VTDLSHNKIGITIAALLSVILLLQSSRPVYAVFNFSVNAEPEIRYAFPGQTVSYTVTVTMITAPASVVSLLVSPWTPQLDGLGFSFSPSASGTPPTSPPYSFARTLYVAVSSAKPPGTYTIPVAGFNPTPGYRTDYVQLVVLAAAAITDWSLSNPAMNPPSPKVGDPTTFSIVLRALSTNQPYPQSVRIAAILDSGFLGSGTLSYPGPTGVPMTVTLTTPWMATEGQHTILWTVDPSPYSYQDPYRYNNEAVLSFTVSAAPPPFDFSLSASPSTQKVTAGQSISYVIVVALVSGSTQPVSLGLAGLPSGVSHSFSPPSSTPSYESTLQVVTTKNAAAGTYTLSLTASGGGLTKTASLTLEIEAAPEEDFSIAVAPTTSEIEQREVSTHTVTISGIAGFKSTVVLSVSSLPAGTTASFSQTKITPDGTSTLTLKTSRQTPTGAHAITIVASGGGKTHDVTLALNVKEGKPTTILEILAEYSLLLVGVLGAIVVALIVLVAVLALRKRQPTPAPAAPIRPSEVFCSSCGSKIPADAQFCAKCGAKRPSI